MSLCQATCMLFCGEPQHTLWCHRWQHKTDMNFVEKKNRSNLCKDVHWNTWCFVKLNVVFYSKFQIITVVFSYLVGGKINVKLPNAFKCLLCNVLYICSVHFLLNLGADAKNYLFPRFMTESSQSEILNNSMLKIQYKHESLIFFCSKKNKTIPFSQI